MKRFLIALGIGFALAAPFLVALWYLHQLLEVAAASSVAF